MMFKKTRRSERLNENEDFTGYAPLFVFGGVAVAGTPVINPDGARTTPGWPTPTGPSRPIMSVSLVLLA